MQLIEQGFGLFQIERVEAFSKPAVDRSKQFASLLRFPLITPEPRHTHCGALFPGLRLLLTRECERTSEILFRFRRIRLWRLQRDFPARAMDLGFEPFLLLFPSPSSLRQCSARRDRIGRILHGL